VTPGGVPAAADREMISRRAAAPSDRPPLLFVHGAWGGAWMWEEHFLDYFAARGFDAHAPSLRAHGRSGAAGALRWLRLRDYVEDVARAAASLPRPPVIVGHSMGGLLVQRYVEAHPVAGVALLCSVPPSGMGRSALRVARHHPLVMLRVNLTLSLMPLIEDVEVAHHLLSSPAMPLDRFRPYHARLQDESVRAFAEMLVPARRRPPAGTPVLVLGAAHDFLFDEHDVRATAAAYGVRAEIVPDIGHTVMLEPDWERFAGRLGDWLDERWPSHG
jgi:pimeloyl-ACP methyl ester carboxylesterase